MSRSTKSSRGLTYYVSYLFILIVFLGVVILGGMYIVNLIMTVCTHAFKAGCPKNQNAIAVAFKSITLWNWFIVAIIVFVFYKLREHL